MCATDGATAVQGISLQFGAAQRSEIQEPEGQQVAARRRTQCAALLASPAYQDSPAPAAGTKGERSKDGVLIASHLLDGPSLKQDPLDATQGGLEYECSAAAQ